MATVRYFWHGFIRRGTTFVYLQHSRPPYLSSFSKCLGDVIHHQRVHLCWPPYSTDKFISCVVPGPSQWFFHYGEEIVISWTYIGWVWWMFQNLPLPVVQEVRDSSSGVTPCIVMKNNGVMYHQVPPNASRSPKQHSCVLRHRATSILIQERCSSFVNMVWGHTHYSYESQRFIHCSRLTEYYCRWLH